MATEGGLDPEVLNGVVHVSDERVQRAVEQATRAACGVLDEMFPGGDARGISSTFQGRLEEVLKTMLNGRDPNSTSMRAPGMNRLALADQDFGSNAESHFAYYVVRVADGWVLDRAGKEFVKPVQEEENVDAYERFDAAVLGAIACMKTMGLSAGEIKVVGVSEAAYKAHGALGSRQEQKLHREFTPAAMEVCSFMGFRLISDLDEDEAGQLRAVYGLGTVGEPKAGLERVIGTPWFASVLDLEVFCKRNVARYKKVVDEQEYPHTWFWEERVPQTA